MERESVGGVGEGLAQMLEVLIRDRRVHEGMRGVLVDLLGVGPLESAMALRVGVCRLAGLAGRSCALRRVGLLSRLLGLDEHLLQPLLVVAQRRLGLLDGAVTTPGTGLG